MTAIDLIGIEKRWDKAVAVAGVDLSIADGELLAILGPSGCGKTTLLTILAGLYRPSSGSVHFDGVDVTDVEARFRNVGIVFQSYALYPHKTVRENIRFPLTYRSIAREEQDRRIDGMAELVQIGELMDRKPSELSGGQQQRVALARALVKEPGLMLLDEPLSNLDAALRLHMRTEIKRLQTRLKVTTVLVTHDQGEAMTLADRIVVMNRGRIEQVGTPDEIAGRPETVFVARFIGSPAMNVVRARADLGAVVVDGVTLVAGLDAQGPIDVGLRPEDLRLADDGLPGRILASERHGREVYHHVETSIGTMIVVADRTAALLAEGEPVRIAVVPGRSLAFSAETGLRLHSDARTAP